VLLLSLRRAALAGAWRRAAQLAVVTTAACATLAAFAVPAGAAARSGPSGGSYGLAATPPPGVAAPGGSATDSLQALALAGAPRQLFVPDLIAAVPSGITPAQLAKITKLHGVQAVLPVDGGKVKVNGKTANVLGVSPQAFRSWTPLSTAGSAAIWSDLAKGQRVRARWPRSSRLARRPIT